jgi:hypothetical protein
MWKVGNIYSRLHVLLVIKTPDSVNFQSNERQACSKPGTLPGYFLLLKQGICALYCTLTVYLRYYSD